MRWLLVLVAMFGLMLRANAETPEKRIALVIGNDDYQTLEPKLDNAANDARAMDQALKAAGFETMLKVNAKRREIYELIDAFAAQIAASPEAVGLFYYAGHGIQANGTNYLIPVDADLVTEQDLEAEAVDAGKVLRAMDQARNRVNIVILDACRNNPLPKGRGLARGLARMDAPRGTFIGYAAGPGEAAEDGPKGGNGIFTAALVHEITAPGQPIEQMFKRVIAAVTERTGGKQAPWMESSLQGNFYFFAPGAQATIIAPQPPSATAGDVRQLEIDFWNSVKDSKNAAEFQEYLRQYPDGSFAGLARIRMAALKAARTSFPLESSAAAAAARTGATAPPTSEQPASEEIPPEWKSAAPQGPTLQGPALKSAGMAPINLVGRWTYTTEEEGVQEEVTIAFQPDGQYREYMRFPGTPQLGTQIVVLHGHYSLTGQTLSITPAGARVLNGPDPARLCGLTTQKCLSPGLTPNRFDIEQVDPNTVRTPLGTARRLPEVAK